MKKIGETIDVFLIVGDDDLLHATNRDVREGDVFSAACGYPRAARAPRMKSDGKTIDEKPCHSCIIQS